MFWSKRPVRPSVQKGMGRVKCERKGCPWRAKYRYIQNDESVSLKPFLKLRGFEPPSGANGAEPAAVGAPTSCGGVCRVRWRRRSRLRARGRRVFRGDRRGGGRRDRGRRRGLPDW